MSSAVAGHRGRGATSKMRCIDVAALFAAAILRRNPDSVVIPFDTSAYDAKMDPKDSILSIAERLAKYGGGVTDCSLPLVAANQKHAKRKFAGIVLVSDNESWVGTGRHGSTGPNRDIWAGRRGRGKGPKRPSRNEKRRASISRRPALTFWRFFRRKD
ncbi:MAG: hypothetical protein SFV81_23290 [Pirellulaceae bacterium]|nr:hypothetical protein [Pirellulaceae bacterium]